jgi:pilus assembly protein Flp/PilA
MSAEPSLSPVHVHQEFNIHCCHGGPENGEGGESMSLKDLVLYLRARFAVEEGQTMAEYGVVLAVIAVAVVVALGLLSTSISNAFDSVRSSL